MKDVRLLYHRPPDRTAVFEHRLVTVEDGCHVTLLERAHHAGPMHIGERVVLEDGAPIVWFTFEGAWHDIGRFHTSDGSFTGYYANVVLPVTFHDALNWECTDLCVDVWLGADGFATALDEDELAEAVVNGWISVGDAERARIEAAQVLSAAAANTWPPAVAREWTLERARDRLKAEQ